MTPRRAARIAAAQVRIAAALAAHRAGPDLVAREAALALVLTPAEVEVLRRILTASHLLHLDPPPTRLHELGLVRPVAGARGRRRVVDHERGRLRPLRREVAGAPSEQPAEVLTRLDHAEP